MIQITVSEDEGYVSAQTILDSHIQIGFAQVNPEDAFDEETGRLIALARLFQSMQESIIADIDPEIRPLDVNFQSYLWSEMHKLWKRVDALTQKLVTLEKVHMVTAARLARKRGRNPYPKPVEATVERDWVKEQEVREQRAAKHNVENERVVAEFTEKFWNFCADHPDFLDEIKKFLNATIWG